MIYLCIYENNSRMIEAEDIIEASMKFYHMEGDFPNEASSRYAGDQIKNMEREVDDLNDKLMRVIEQRDLAITKLNDIFHEVKVALTNK